jgi:hypothetical protein
LTGQEEAIEEGTDIMFDLPSSNLDLQDTRAFAITIKADLPISKINHHSRAWAMGFNLLSGTWHEPPIFGY